MAYNTRNNQGTGFVNYNDILNANQGAGARMGQLVGQGLQSQAGAVKKEQEKQQGEFGGALGAAGQEWSNTSELANQLAKMGKDTNYAGIAGVTKQTATPVQSSVPEAPQLRTANTSGDNQIGNPPTTPNTDTSIINPTDVGEIGEKFANYQYGGPQGYTNATGLTNQAQAASQQGRQASTAQGQQDLLRQYVAGGRNYAPGLAAFDQSLLGKQGQAAIGQGKKALSGISTDVQKNIINAQARAAAQKSATEQQKTDLQKQITDTYGGLLDLGKTQGTQFNTDLGNIKSILGFDPTKGDLTPQQTAMLSTLTQKLHNYGVDTDQSIYNNKLNSSVNPSLISGMTALGAGLRETGNTLYQGPQQQAAANLAAFLGNKGDVAGLINDQGIIQEKQTYDPANRYRAFEENREYNANDKAYTEYMTSVMPQLEQARTNFDFAHSGYGSYAMPIPGIMGGNTGPFARLNAARDAAGNVNAIMNNPAVMGSPEAQDYIKRQQLLTTGYDGNMAHMLDPKNTTWASNANDAASFLNQTMNKANEYQEGYKGGQTNLADFLNQYYKTGVEPAPKQVIR